MAIGNSIGISWPAEGIEDWWSPLQTELQKIVDSIEEPVTPGGMNFNDDVDFNINELSGIKAASFSNQAASLDGDGVHNKTLYTVAGELYFNDGSNQAVKLTSNGSLNAAATNGITNISGGTDYGSGPEIVWDGPNSEYELKDGSGDNDHAPLRLSEVRLADGSDHAITLVSPSLSANYTITFPNAAPASSTSLVQISTGGTLTYTNTVSAATTFSSAVTCQDALDVSSDITVTGAATAATLKNTSTQKRIVSAYNCVSASSPSGLAGGYYTVDSGYIRLPLPTESVDTFSVTVYYYVIAGGGTPWTISLESFDMATGATATPSSGTSTGGLLTSITLTGGVASATKEFWVEFYNGSFQIQVAGAVISYTQA